MDKELLQRERLRNKYVREKLRDRQRRIKKKCNAVEHCTGPELDDSDSEYIYDYYYGGDYDADSDSDSDYEYNHFCLTGLWPISCQHYAYLYPGICGLDCQMCWPILG